MATTQPFSALLPAALVPAQPTSHTCTCAHPRPHPTTPTQRASVADYGEPGDKNFIEAGSARSRTTLLPRIQVWSDPTCGRTGPVHGTLEGYPTEADVDAANTDV